MPARRSVPQRVTDSFRAIAQLDLSHLYEAQAGLITIIVLAAVVLVALFVSGWRLGGGRTVDVLVRFGNVTGLSGGDLVQVSGVTVGRVRAIDLQPSGDVLVRLRLDRHERPHRDARVQIISLSLIGDRAVDYSPGVAPEFLAEGDELEGADRSELQERLATAAERGMELAVAGAAFARADLRNDLAAARAATAHALAVMGRVQGDSLLVAAADVLRASQGTFARLDSVAAELAAEAAGGGLDAAAASAGDLADAAGAARDALDRVQQRLGEGEGGLARLPGDSAFRNALAATRHSLALLQAKYLGRRPPPVRSPR